MRNQLGVSMIEILITIVVMSFGFLSLAAFQMGTLKHLSGSNQHFFVTSLATSMGEGIRAVDRAKRNDVGASDYHNLSTASSNKDCSDVSACTLPERDMQRWKDLVNSHGLEDGNAQVEIDGDVVRITISWVEKSTNALINSNNSETQTYTLQVPLDD